MITSPDPSPERMSVSRRREHARLSSHAKRRAKDRSIPDWIVDALFDFGVSRDAGGGAVSYSFTKRSWRRFAAYVGHLAHHVERYRSVYIVAASDGEVITVAWRH